MVKPDIFKNAFELINKSKDILITTHTRPDGDACGCVAALTESLKALDKKVTALILSELPQWYEFLFEETPLLFEPEKSQEQLNNADLVILVDVNSANQLPKFAEWLKASKKQILVFDHHVTNDGLGDIEAVDTSACATGLIIYDFLKFIKLNISESISKSLFVSIASDTGWFKFSNTDSRSFAIAAELIEAGAKPNELHKKLYQNFTTQRFKLMTRMLDSLELHFDGRFAIQHLTISDFSETGASNKDTENLIDECRRIESVQAAALLIELKDGRVRCSLRSSDKIDVRKVAQEFGGGGHIFAAGVYLPGPLENAKKIVLELIGKQF